MKSRAGHAEILNKSGSQSAPQADPPHHSCMPASVHLPYRIALVDSDALQRLCTTNTLQATGIVAWSAFERPEQFAAALRAGQQFDLALVHEALHERGLLATRLAPHLVRPLPLLLPLPRGGWRGPVLRGYFGAGIAAYDIFAGLFGRGRGMPLHRHLSASAARRLFPSLRGDTIGGAIRFYDAQVDDARLVTTLARTAASLGAAVVTSARPVWRMSRRACQA